MSTTTPIDEPPPFPTRGADLAAWWAHADRIMPAAPRLGALIAGELALPAAPDRAQLHAFHQAARPRCAARQSYVGWCLGHARSLTLFGRGRSLLPSAGALANAYDFMRRPVGARLESLYSAYRFPVDRGTWRRLWSALPSTCTHVTLHLDPRSDTGLEDELLEHLPASVRTLQLFEHLGRWRERPIALPRFVSDRFDVVDLTGFRAGEAQEDGLAAALSATRKVALRVAMDVTRIPMDRRQLVPPGAAALVGQIRRRLVALERWSLLARQRRYGVIPVQAQIAGTLPEWHWLAGWLLAEPPDGSAYDVLVRRGERWTLRSDPSVTCARNGTPIEPGTIVELAHGDTLTVRSHATHDEATCELVGRDVDAICRQRLRALAR
jgi:hypothetical protein